MKQFYILMFSLKPQRFLLLFSLNFKLSNIEWINRVKSQNKMLKVTLTPMLGRSSFMVIHIRKIWIFGYLKMFQLYLLSFDIFV